MSSLVSNRFSDSISERSSILFGPLWTSRVPWSHSGIALGVVPRWTEVMWSTSNQRLCQVIDLMSGVSGSLCCFVRIVIYWGLLGIRVWFLMLADKNQVAKACLCPKWGDARDDAIICLWPRQQWIVWILVFEFRFVSWIGVGRFYCGLDFDLLIYAWCLRAFMRDYNTSYREGVSQVYV